MKSTMLILAFIFTASGLYAQQFRYEPKNPFFGGDTFNYQQLLASANAQNGLTAPSTTADQPSDLEAFGDQLQASILSQISRTLTQQQVNAIEGITEPGSFAFGNLALDVFETAEGLIINILDTSNGEETQIVVPN